MGVSGRLFAGNFFHLRASVRLCLWLWVGLVLAGCGQEELVRVDTEKQANEILVELAAHQITDARKQPKAKQRATVWLLTVPKADLLRAREVLVQLDLPRKPKGGYERMLATTGLIPTKTDERARLMYAMSGELERTFEVYESVVQARVHVVIPEAEPMSGQNTKNPAPTAMVLIQHVDHKNATGSSVVPTEDQVRQMVAKSVEGLAPDHVAVSYTMARRRKLSESPPTSIWADPMFHLWVGAAAMGGLSIVLIVLLIREKARQR